MGNDSSHHEPDSPPKQHQRKHEHPETISVAAICEYSGSDKGSYECSAFGVDELITASPAGGHRKPHGHSDGEASLIIEHPGQHDGCDDEECEADVQAFCSGLHKGIVMDATCISKPPRPSRGWCPSQSKAGGVLRGGACAPIVTPVAFADTNGAPRWANPLDTTRTRPNLAVCARRTEGVRRMQAPWLTDSGLETWLVFHRGIDLADFAAFPLLDERGGRELLADYFREHLRVAQEAGTGIVLETPTWRASADWGERLGYDAAALDRVNRDAVAFLRGIADEFTGVATVVSGNMGPRGDGYGTSAHLSPKVAASYHRPQVDSFAAAGADRVTMLTATHAGEAIGVVQAAGAAGIPVVMAFTLETDGRLPSGQPLQEAIEEVDASTGAAALYFGINCAHPDHFSPALAVHSDAIGRVQLLRANASRASHAELDEAEELDDGDPAELAGQYAELQERHRFTVLGGCCGTDVRHVRAIADACVR